MTTLLHQRSHVGSVEASTEDNAPLGKLQFIRVLVNLHLRGIEVLTMTDANAIPEGLKTNRRKGSRDNIVAWTPRLQAAWEAAVQRRANIWEKRGRAVPLNPARRPLIISRNGDALQKSSFDSAWQRFIHNAIEDGAIDIEDRFGLHDLKRRGITYTEGNRHDKQDAAGHRSPAMMDVYDLSLPVVPISETHK